MVPSCVIVRNMNLIVKVIKGSCTNSQPLIKTCPMREGSVEFESYKTFFFEYIFIIFLYLSFFYFIFTIFNKTSLPK